MNNEDVDSSFRSFSSFLKRHREDMHETKGFNESYIQGKGSYIRNRSQGVERCGQGFPCIEAIGSKPIEWKKRWFPRHTNGFGARQTYRGHRSGFKFNERCHRERKSPWYYGQGGSSKYVGGHGRGGFHGNPTCDGGYHHSVSNHKDAGNFTCNGERWNSQLSTGGRWKENKVFTYKHGKRGGRGRYSLGSYTGGGLRCGINEDFQSEKSNVKASIWSSVDMDPIEQLACKTDDNVDSIQALRDTGDYDTLHMDENKKEECHILGRSCNNDSQLPIDQRSELPAVKFPTQEDIAVGSCDQRHLERAFISCAGGMMKRRRAPAVRDFPVRRGKLRFVSMNTAIVKSKVRKSNVRECLMMEESVEAFSEPELAAVGELSRARNKILAPPDQGHVDLEVIMENCNNQYHQITDSSPGQLRGELESTQLRAAERNSFAEGPPVGPRDIPLSCNALASMEDLRKPTILEVNAFADFRQVRSGEIVDNHSILSSSKNNTSKPIVAEGNSSRDLSENSSAEIVENCNGKENASDALLVSRNSLAELSQGSSLETVIQKCNISTLTKEDSWEEQVSKISEVNSTNTGDEILLFENNIGFYDNDEIIAELSVQGSDKKDIQICENSLHISSPFSNTKAFDVGTSSFQTPSQANEQTLPKVTKKKRRPDTLTVNGVCKPKSRPTNVFEGPMNDLHDLLHESKKLKGYNLIELENETCASVIHQSIDSGNVRNKDARTRLVHKGSIRAKVFQTSKSFDPKDATKLSNLEAVEGLSDRALVKRTLHEFESIRKALVKSQNAVKRADLDAGSLLREKGKWRNCGEKIIGEVPGVEVGDQFSFRMEMLIIGLHRQVQSGIDYIPGTKRHNGSPLATSIVASGGYEDDKDDGHTLIYSGQGGNNMKGNKKQESNQVLVRGNLALSNSMTEKTPVRVIRGTADSASPSSKVYIYDGLYDVVNYAFECGAAGFRVYQFTLIRRLGQPQVGLSFLINLKKKGLTRPNLLLGDISGGQERLPICVVNEVDEEPAPLQFSYIPRIKYPAWHLPFPPRGCECVGVCDEETCSCSIKNGGELPYNEKGYIVRDKEVIYECGPLCSCSSSCENRVSQKGLRYRLEIFKTKNRGWGVRSLDSIQPGGFICEYTGELLSDAEAEQRIENDEYLFDLGNKCKPSVVQPDLADMNATTAFFGGADDVAYTIDAKGLGNVARFINHSCSPNLYAQNVLYDSDDLRFPHVMLFAMENIPPMRELTYDYNYSIDQVRDADGNVKIKACYCGAQDCQGRLY